MLLMIMATAAASATSLSPLAACTAAVHSNEPTEQACAVPAAKPDRLWAGGGLPPACLAALSVGRSVSRSRDLPPAMLAGIVKSYDAKATACETPPMSAVPNPHPADRKTTQRLWD